MKHRALFGLTVLLQVAYLGVVAGYHGLRVQGGTKVLLETAPVDPLSIFRGRYVTLNYKISTLPTALLTDMDAANLKAGETVYVLLAKREGFWEAASIHARCPQTRTCLRGTVRDRAGDSLSLQYGIESFFLSEASADQIEEHRRNQWRTRREQPTEALEQLSTEDRRIKEARIPEWWLKTLKGELPQWVMEGLVTPEHSQRITAKYEDAFAHIREAEQAARTRQTASAPPSPLTIEVSVTSDGTGYPVRLFWEGREYR